MYIVQQTFFIDANAAGNSDSVFLSSVDIYFKKKPSATNNASGITNPGVRVSILNTTMSNVPNQTAEYLQSVKRLAYSEISTSSDASVATKFTFDQLVPLFSGKSYAIQIKTEDPDYDVWMAKSNDAVVGSNAALPGFSSNFQGQLFDYFTDGTITPRASTQLKFDVNIAQFTANTQTYYLTNKDFEFFTVTGQSGQFTGGENVFQIAANATGTVSFTSGGTTLTGTGTSFDSIVSVGGHLVLWANSSTCDVVTVSAKASNTSLTVSSAFAYTNSSANFFAAAVGSLYQQNQPANTVYLTDSYANSTLKFSSSGVIRGKSSNKTATIVSVDNVAVAQFKPEIGVTIPNNGNCTVSYSFAYSNGSAYVVDTGNFKQIDNNKLELISDYNSLVMSRSNEVANPTYLYSGKSAIVKIVLGQNGVSNATFNNIYTSPYIYQEKLDFFTGRNLINNDNTSENTRYGNALSKHITTKITFDKGKSAEDALVYITAYKPTGTDIVPYIKLHNTKDTDAFDDKEWTQLGALYNSNAAVSSSATGNYIEYSFGIPTSPPSAFTANGTVTTASSNATITGFNTQFGTDIVANNVVKIYSPLFPTQFQVALVTAVANTTSLTINSPITNASMVASGLKIDVVSDPYTAFINPQNGNIVRYYSQDLTEYDTFDTMQIKVDLLSDNVSVSPRINNIRALGVSA
jgi:hypothetical protein